MRATNRRSTTRSRSCAVRSDAKFRTSRKKIPDVRAFARARTAPSPHACVRDGAQHRRARRRTVLGAQQWCPAHASDRRDRRDRHERRRDRSQGPRFDALQLRVHGTSRCATRGTVHSISIRYIDSDAVIATRRSARGRILVALERPGLWNGAMARWNTVFVEVPLDVFHPVKTVLRSPEARAPAALIGGRIRASLCHNMRRRMLVAGIDGVLLVPAQRHANVRDRERRAPDRDRDRRP